ncbi:hypothetical protein [Nocardia sp. NPDC019395]|uniref:hypothetical protein n=1 Tax=Nocardia sp. NPDC019395 TaxID=3154686 RepID=UPI0033D67D05
MQSRRVVVLAREQLEKIRQLTGSISSFTARVLEDTSHRTNSALNTFDKVDRPFEVRINGEPHVAIARTVDHRKTPGELQTESQKSTGRTTPGSREEAEAISLVRENAEYGDVLTNVRLKDPRWPAEDGWVKMSMTVHDIEIHYVRNPNTREVADFKFKDRTEPNR